LIQRPRYQLKRSERQLSIRKTVDELINSHKDASKSLIPILLAFIGIMLSIWVSTASITHVVMLIGKDFDIPFFSIKFSLDSFGLIAPTVLIIMHIWVLLHLARIANIRTSFEQAVQKSSSAPKIINDDLILSSLSKSETELRFESRFARALGTALFAVLPVVILLNLQFKYLPLHENLLTWSQRSAVILDLLIIAIYWPAIEGGRGLKLSEAMLLVLRRVLWFWWVIPLTYLFFKFKRLTRNLVDKFSKKLKTSVKANPATKSTNGWMASIANMAAVVACLFVASFPGDGLDRVFYPEPTFNFPTGYETFWDAFADEKLSDGLTMPNMSGLDKIKKDGSLLFDFESMYHWRSEANGGRKFIGWHPNYFHSTIFGFSRNLDVSGEDIKTKEGFREINLSGRDLRYAIFKRASLNNVDFQGALLDFADFSHSKLNDVRMQLSSGDYVNFQNSKMTRVNMDRVSFYGADYSFSKLVDVRMDSSDLRGIIFEYVDAERLMMRSYLPEYPIVLTAGSFIFERAVGVSMVGADLTGAKLIFLGQSLAAANGTKDTSLSQVGIDLRSAQLNGTLLHLDAEGVLLSNVNADYAINSQRPKPLTSVGKILLRASLGSEKIATDEQMHVDSFSPAMRGYRMPGAMPGFAKVANQFESLLEKESSLGDEICSASGSICMSTFPLNFKKYLSYLVDAACPAWSLDSPGERRVVVGFQLSGPRGMNWTRPRSELLAPVNILLRARNFIDGSMLRTDKAWLEESNKEIKSALTRCGLKNATAQKLAGAVSRLPN
jgi:uncharacterized protein YjbI with pentapeptide repeats